MSTLNHYELCVRGLMYVCMYVCLCAFNICTNFVFLIYDFYDFCSHDFVLIVITGE